MAGHSKWAQIKRTKAVKDQKKGASFAKSAKEIMVAVRLGGPDPAANFRLRTAIDKAKEAGLPNDNIRRAIERGQGGGDGPQMETLNYEGYGPGGVAVLVEAMTDNRNRTAGDVRSLFTKYGGNLGAEGCVGWMFEESGEILVAYDIRIREETLFEAAIEAGAQDFEADPDARVFRIKATPDDLNSVATTLSQHELRFPVDNVATIRTPQTQAEVATFEQAYNLVRLLNALEELDDVRAVHNNADIPDALYEQVEKKLMALH